MKLDVQFMNALALHSRKVHAHLKYQRSSKRRHVFFSFNLAHIGWDQILLHSMDRCFNRHVLFHSPDRRFERELCVSRCPKLCIKGQAIHPRSLEVARVIIGSRIFSRKPETRNKNKRRERSDQ